MEKQIQEYIQRIIVSKSFGRSKTYENLLLYLVECSQTDKIPKETTIASEIFNKTSFDPSQNTLVRVYIYNLRKKLKQYYQNEGLDDEVILHIPKGSYKVEFNKQDKVKKKAFVISRTAIGIIVLFLLSVSLLVNVYLWKQNKVEKVSVEPELWDDLLKSDLPTMVVLGDLFIYTEHDSIMGLSRNIRDPYLNSLKEFETFAKTHSRPGIRFESRTYTYLIRNSVSWIKNLTKIFFSKGKRYSIRTMSRFNPKELYDHDIVVIGMLKTMGIFNAYFQNSNFKFHTPNTIVYQSDTLGKEIFYTSSGKPHAYHTDYGIMAKFPGPNHNTIYLFGGLWDTATSQSLKNFTDPHLMKTLVMAMKEKFGNVPKYYEVFFEARGIDRMELSTKIIHMNQIEHPSKVWMIDQIESMGE